MSPTTRFLRTWLLGTLLAMAGVAGFAALVDPYGMFDSPRWEGFNAKKPAAENRSHVVKPYAVARREPAVLILGNSRPEMGLDPEHPCIAAVGPAYSLTLPGASLYQQARYLQHALAFHTPKVVLFGVDFLDFLVKPDSDADPYRWPPYFGSFEARLAVTAEGAPTPGRLGAKLADYRDALLSLTAFSDAIKTIATQKLSLSSTRTPEGFNPAIGMPAMIAAEGQHVFFAQKEQEVMQLLVGSDLAMFQGDDDWSTVFTALEHVIRMTRERGIRLILFINPYHARYLGVIDQAGYAERLKRWKARVRQLASAHDLEFWDFARINAFTSEPPPPPGDTETVLRWFWEPAHYRRELGNMMLEQMLCGDADQAAPIASGEAPNTVSGEGIGG
jgi:hypothetical protein